MHLDLGTASLGRAESAITPLCVMSPARGMILRGSEVPVVPSHRYSLKYSFMIPQWRYFRQDCRVMAHLPDAKIDAHVGGSCHELPDFARQ